MGPDQLNPDPVDSEVLRRLLGATRARRALSQNFLVDLELRDAIAAAALELPHPILEVGPGPGALTHALGREGGRVVAIELDPALARVARQVTAGFPGVEIREGDATQTEIGTVFADPYQVVANLPYHLTGLMIPVLTGAVPPPVRLLLLVQREVAQRLAAGEGSGWSLSTLALRLYGLARIRLEVPPTAFDPAPRVWSALLEVTHDPVEAPPQLLDLARRLFQQRRKQLRNSVAAALGDPSRGAAALAAAAIDPTRRAEELGMGEWLRLVAAAGDFQSL